MTLDPLLGPIGGGLAFAAGASAGASAVVEEPSVEGAAGDASSAALTTSLEPKLLIGKKDTEELFEDADEPPPTAAVTLVVRINPVAADVIAIYV